MLAGVHGQFGFESRALEPIRLSRFLSRILVALVGLTGRMPLGLHLSNARLSNPCRPLWSCV